MEFDAEASRLIEAAYATPDIAATRGAVFRALNLRSGDNVADIGCGPGYLLADLAPAVGETGRALGVDVSEAMVATARQRCSAWRNVEVSVGDVTALDIADGTLDAVSMMQVMAYVPDLDAALGELRRVLRPGGRLVVLDTDYDGLVWQSRDRERMRRVRNAYDAHAPWPDVVRLLPEKLARSGFELERLELAPIVTTNYHPNTFVYGFARFLARFVVQSGGMDGAQVQAWLDEFDQLEHDRAFLFSLPRFVFSARRS